MSSGSPGRARVWWLSPVAVVVLTVPLVVGATLLTPASVFRSQWQVDKVITVSTGLLLLAAGLAVACGAALGLSRPTDRDRPLAATATGAIAERGPQARCWPGLHPVRRRALERANTVLFALTALGYLTLIGLAVTRGVGWTHLATALDEGVYGGPIRRTVGTVAGLTTLTQVGIATAVVSAVLLADRPTTRQVVLLTTVIALTLPRTYFLAERLALLEVMAPVVAVIACRLSVHRVGRRAVALAPAVAVPAVAAVFAVFEYTRSWVFHRLHTVDPFAQWVAQRLTGYYATALNNAALQLRYDEPGRWPYAVFSAFWNAPGISGSGMYSSMSRADPIRSYRELLATHGAPEFRNSSGLGAPIVDLGAVGGVALMFVAGLLLGAAYHGMTRGHTVGLLCYPVLFTGLLELTRVMPWTSGRTAPALLAVLLVACWVAFAARSTATAGNGPTPAATGPAPVQPVSSSNR